MPWNKQVLAELMSRTQLSNTNSLSSLVLDVTDLTTRGYAVKADPSETELEYSQ